MLRNVAVTANPTNGGSFGKHDLIVSFMYPWCRGRTSNSSMTLQTVGVSYLARASRVAVVMDMVWCESVEGG
jgi:hypothetical protein